MAELSGNAIGVHQLITDEIHNDSISITFQGSCEDIEPNAVNITYGYNKDHRPECKQLVFGLNVTADSHVPLSYQLYDGNQADISTHQANWEQLRTMLGKEQFIYVADSKLCSYDNLSLIDENGGQFITVLPRNLNEAKDFLGRLQAGEEIEWHHEHNIPDSRKTGLTHTYRIHVGEQMGHYRVLWIHSSSKEKTAQ